MIGSGGIFTRHTVVEGLLAANYAELVAVCDIGSELEQVVRSECQIKHVDSIDELLRVGVDAVFVVSEDLVRAEHVERAIQAGKHVLCEESPGRNLTQTRQLIALCHKHGVLLGSAFFLRFVSEFQQALELSRDGILGTLRYGRIFYTDSYPTLAMTIARQNPVADIGCHCIDLLEMFFGEASKVHCFSSRKGDDLEVVDSSVVSLYFKDGGMGHVYVSLSHQDDSTNMLLELYGSLGYVTVEVAKREKAKLKLHLYGKSLSEVRKGECASLLDGMNPYQAEIEEFCCAILEKDTPYNSAELGLRSQHLHEACELSVRDGVTVELPFGEALLSFISLFCCF